MEDNELMEKLISSLENIYYLEGFVFMSEFLQGEVYILHFLSQNINKEISPSIISECLHMTRPRVTAVINTLRRKNYVRTYKNTKDKRRLNIKLTEEGLNFINDKQVNVKKYIQLFVDSIGENNVKDFIRIMDLAVEKMNKK